MSDVERMIEECARRIYESEFADECPTSGVEWEMQIQKARAAWAALGKEARNDKTLAAGLGAVIRKAANHPVFGMLDRDRQDAMLGRAVIAGLFPETE